MSEYLNQSGGRLAYDAAGSGPLVVLAHGLGDDRSSYDGVVPHLTAAGFRVATTDLRGCGQSSVGWSDYGRTAIAGDLIALIRHLGGPAVLVGHSISGGAATIAAATEPALVSAVVELAPFTRPQSFGLSNFKSGPVRKATLSLLGAGMGRARSWRQYLNVATPAPRPEDFDSRLDRIAASLAEPGHMAALKAMIRSNPSDSGVKLTDVRQPTVIVMGDADPDWADPETEADGIVAALPAGAGSRVILEGVGHYPHYQRPEQVAEIILVQAGRAAGA